MAAMVIDMNKTRLCSLEQLKAFLDYTAGIQFRPFEGDDTRYAHIVLVLGCLADAWLRIAVPRASAGWHRKPSVGSEGAPRAPFI